MVEYEAKSNTMDSEIMSEKPGINPVLSKSGVTASGNRTEAGKVPFGQPPAKPQPEPEKKPEDQLKKKFDKNEAKHVSFDKFLDDNGAHKKREQNKSWITDVFLPLQVDP